MRVCIIGAGAAGLASARHITAQGIDCQIFEMASELGGTWVYTDDVGTDKYGFPVHTAMYKGLRTNLPKEVMGFPDFPIPERNESYLSQTEILDFLNLYADHFRLKDLITFNQMVTDVRPIEDKWQIKSIHKLTKEQTSDTYDVVMVCNGHYNTPFMLSLLGQEKFKGPITHSHQYRSAEAFKGKRVLVIGAGFSGLDIALQISPVAEYVVISYHVKKREIQANYPTNVSMKPQVLRIKDDYEVEFEDGSCCGFDAILHCTGYIYNFPFLHETCGITIEDNHIQPLYKHIVHIDRPTLCFIGIPFYVCAFQMFDLQARFYCQYLNGSMSLPSKEMMRKDVEEDMAKRRERGCNKREMHLLGPCQQEYFEDVASRAKITPIAPVITQIWNESDSRFYSDLPNFRKDRYRIVNNKVFVKVN